MPVGNHSQAEHDDKLIEGQGNRCLLFLEMHRSISTTAQMKYQGRLRTVTMGVILANTCKHMKGHLEQPYGPTTTALCMQHPVLHQIISKITTRQV